MHPLLIRLSPPSHYVCDKFSSLSVKLRRVHVDRVRNVSVDAPGLEKEQYSVKYHCFRLVRYTYYAGKLIPTR